jgi:hypothetical protein
MGNSRNPSCQIKLARRGARGNWGHPDYFIQKEHGMNKRPVEQLYIVSLPTGHENEIPRQVAFKNRSEADRLSRFFNAASCKHHKYNTEPRSQVLPIYSSAHAVLNDLLDELAPPVEGEVAAE